MRTSRGQLPGVHRVFADARAERRIGTELRRYFQESAWFEVWLERVKAIVVYDGVIAIATDLRPTTRSTAATT